VLHVYACKYNGLNNKRLSWAALGWQEEKRSEVERELNDAQHRVESAKDTYELIVRRMSQELARFQQERATEMAGVLRAFAVAQATLASDTAKAWRTLAPVPSSNGAAR
jgi:hypothetical protein